MISLKNFFMYTITIFFKQTKFLFSQKDTISFKE